MRRSTRAGLGLVALGAGLAAAGCSGKADTTAGPTTASTAAPDSTTTTELPLTAGKVVSFYVPAVGDCFDRRQPDIKKPDVVVLELDCNLPHSFEVFGVVDVPDKDYPGEDALQALGKQQCPKQFKAYVGTPFETSIFDMGYETPTAADWGQGIRHTLGCYAADMKGAKLTGSVKGTGK